MLKSQTNNQPENIMRETTITIDPKEASLLLELLTPRFNEIRHKRDVQPFVEGGEWEFQNRRLEEVRDLISRLVDAL
jgi:hypothetical protein